ncbi:hypothetical protein SDC9_151123 [bioreactor metagenome]|uniref:Uncharacterized protein n=1 Tax=bioreactor metagenome TaxID=1076179 RepID=A0A645EPF5_9ZZZZ
MTNHQKGYRRDRQVIETITEWGTMDTEQLTLMFYPSIQVARRRLRIMSNKGKLNRFRDAVEMPYSYYIKQYSQTRIALNWIRLWLKMKHCRSWEVIESFDYETNTAVTRNTVGNSAKTYTVLYNVNRKTWIGENVIIIYDTEQQKREAFKRIKGILLTIDDIKEGLKCVKCS